MTITVELKSEGVLALLLDLERLDLLKLGTVSTTPTNKNNSKGKAVKPPSSVTTKGQLPSHTGSASDIPDLGTALEMVPHSGLLLPVTPATEKPDIGALAGIWKDKDITLEKLRRDAWGNRL